MNYILLSIFWILWCFLHSFLISTKTTLRFKNRLGDKLAFYRILYNLFSLVTVLLLFYWQHRISGPVVIKLSPYLLIFKYIVLTSSLVVIAGAFFTFDVLEFGGIRQIIKRGTSGEGRETRDEDKKQKTGSGGLKTEQAPVISKHGFFGIVRHPMYLGAFIFCVASMTNAPLAQFLGYFILAVYMIIGTVREDRRLARELGDVYRNYQKEVPMILPKILGKRSCPKN